jgi:hypothetical protein
LDPSAHSAIIPIQIEEELRIGIGPPVPMPW